MSESTSLILQSLSVVYNAASSNEHRQQATVHLESLKDESDAPLIGLGLAQDSCQSHAVRHYGLLLLEHCIQHKWDSYADKEATQIRLWILQLAHTTVEEDPSFFRNKIALLLEEIVEKSWGLSWFDLDEQLCTLWQGPVSHKKLVLHALETLSERVFGKDEAASGDRGAELGRFCIEIFAPCTDLIGKVPEAPLMTELPSLRQSSQSWVERVVDFLKSYLRSDGHIQSELRECSVMALSLLRSCMSWLPLKSIGSMECVEVVSECINLQNVQIQMVGLVQQNADPSHCSSDQNSIRPLISSLMSSLAVQSLSDLCVSIPRRGLTRNRLPSKSYMGSITEQLFFERTLPNLRFHFC